MTDRIPPAPQRDLRRWPVDPAQLVDTTCCPACFSRLYSSRCMVCDLELGVPAAIDLLAISTRMYEEERRRQSLISSMREAQAATLTPKAAVPVAARVSAVAPAPPAPPAPPAIPDAAAAAPAPTPAAPAPASPVPASPSPDARPRRSGVQVLLLTLGVVLISVTAIVFLFVAYLVASLEVRSVIIAAASVLVLGAAWLLRARHLPGTAEGVASVAVVLLLLDVWIVRANELFGTDALNTAAYTGIAFAVVAGLLAATRALSGIRVAGFAAAALAPVAAFLLGYAVDPETATGLWFGGLIAAGVGATVIALASRSRERVIITSAGFGGAAIALVAAPWALPDLLWNESWALAVVAAVFLLIAVAARKSRAGAAAGWSRTAMVGAGLAATLAPAAGIASEAEAGLAIWLAPAAAGAVTAIAAGVSRLPARTGREARGALVAAAVVAMIAAIPGLLAGAAAIGVRVVASSPPWQVTADERVLWVPSDLDFGIALVPFVVCAGTAVVLLIAGILRRFVALPVAAALGGVLVIGASAPGAAVPAAVFAVVGAGALVLASTGLSARVPSLLSVLALFGMSGAALAVVAAYSNTAIWPWVIAAVVAMTVAGRVLAPRIWSAGSAPTVGTVHLAAAMLLSLTAASTLPLWLEASGVGVSTPWDSPWMWLGVVGAALLAVGILAGYASDADRMALVQPALVASTVAAFVVAFSGTADFAWLPASLTAVVAIVGLRVPSPVFVCVSLASVGPLLAAVAVDRALAGVAGAPPAVLGAAAAVLLAAGTGPVLVPRAARGARIAWCASLGIAGIIALLGWSTAGEQQWLLLLLLAPVPMLVASNFGDPIGGSSMTRHLSWLSLPLVVGAAWSWLSGEGIDDVEAYTLPLAAVLATAGALITWRRVVDAPQAAGRTALFAAAAAIAVLPSVASSGDSEIRTLVLVAFGVVVGIASMYLPDLAGGVPVRLLGVSTGWVALTGAALVRAGAVALGESSPLPVEFWPGIALAAGIAIAVIWARAAAKPALVAEAILAASLVAASLPTVLAIVSGEQSLLRSSVLLPLLAVAHVASVAATVRPFAGPVLEWTTLGTLVLAAIAVTVAGAADPFDLVTASIGAALVGAGALRMRRSRSLGSWPALGPGLAVLLIPPLIADFTDPEVWRIVALGIVASAAVVLGAVWRLQSPLLLGGAVLLVHAVAQLWPWITWLYEAVWWWLWLGFAGVVLIALAATYERQLRLARGTLRSIGTLR